MRVFFDFEFIENGDQHPIIPVSIGIVREDERAYYAEFKDVDWSLANPWVITNVKPHLYKYEHQIKSKEQITQDIIEFVGKEPEFWGYYADYDWVILCGMYGSMMNRPDSWPMRSLDIEQYMWHLGLSSEDIPVTNVGEHDALNDAHYNHELFNYCLELQKSTTEDIA
jgi:hypothetical protein